MSTKETPDVDGPLTDSHGAKTWAFTEEVLDDVPGAGAMVCGVDCHPGDAKCNNYCRDARVKSPPAREASTAPGEPCTTYLTGISGMANAPCHYCGVRKFDHPRIAQGAEWVAEPLNDSEILTLEVWATRVVDGTRCLPTPAERQHAKNILRFAATVAALTADRARLAELREDELAAIYREHARIAATLEARLHDAERDAERWRAIVGCQRVRVLGYARLGQPDQHIGFELWEQYPPDTIGTTGNDVSRADLTTFADAAAVRAPRGTAR